MNAVAIRNTSYQMAAIAHLNKTGHEISDLVHLSPLTREHINLHSTYCFDLTAPAKCRRLKPLSTPEGQLRA